MSVKQRRIVSPRMAAGLGAVVLAAAAGTWTFVHQGASPAATRAPQVATSVASGAVPASAPGPVVACSGPSCSTAPVAAAPGPAYASPADRSVDQKRMADVAASLLAGSVEDQVQAIGVLGKVGTAEQKAVIVEQALNPKAEVAVRLAALENIDWDRHLDVIANVVRGGDPQVAQAALYVAASHPLTPDQTAQLTEAVKPVFADAKTPALQLAVLHFLLERDKTAFDTLAQSARIDSYSEPESQELIDLLAQRKQERDMLNAAEPTQPS